tara:strand:- start:1715 stop:1948 length:234 start_codon:yes stop_codon:yes gene_type:complete
MFKNISDEEIEKLSFEDCFKKLEEIVEILEDNNSNLEDSISYYDLGVRLKNHCNKKLRSAELKIQKLSDKNDLKDYN